MDLQPIMNAYGCIRYISCVTKKEGEEGELLKLAQQQAHDGNEDAIKEIKMLSFHFSEIY